LRALVGVEDLGPAVAAKRLFQRLKAEAGRQLIDSRQAKDLAAEPVDDGRQVDEAPRH
jgi:hypothetical protein